MASYKPYHPEQAELLPAHVRDILGENHLCFLIHEVVEELDLSRFEAAYGDAGGELPYHPRLMVKVWLYAFALKVKSTRKLEQRLQEDLGFRFLAGGARPQDAERVSAPAPGGSGGIVRASVAHAAAGGAGAAGRSGH